MFNKSIFIGLFSSLALGSAIAGDAGFKLEPLHVNGMIEAGELVSFISSQSGPIAPNDLGSENSTSELIDHSAVWFLQEASLTDNIKVFLGVGGTYFFYLPASGAKNNTYGVGQRSAFGLTDAHGEFEFLRHGESDHGILLKAGVFNFKYNEDAKNLGEYMFRTYTYPNIIMTGGLVLVNTAGAQLNGLDANTRYGGFTNDLLLTDKTSQVPTGSLSLTDIVSYTYRNFLTVGGGFMFDNFYNPDGVADGISVAGAYVNTSPEYYIENGDTLHYKFAGQKVMVRAALDIGTLIGSSFLSDKDLRLYGEAILMGLKDYPIFYPKMANRIAYMGGVNLPTLHVLDLLSLEFEYFRNPNGDNTSKVTGGFAPIPSDPDIGHEQVKWTVYVKKNVVKGFSISAQAANDHTRLVDFYGHTNDVTSMQRHKDWYWALQLNYSI